MVSSLALPRAVMVAGVIVLALAACGRRGALEAPPDPSAAQKPAAKQAAAQPGSQTAQPGSQAAGPGQTDEEEADSTLPSPVGTPRKRNAKRGYVIPKEPFILDPIL
jgi:predicted small lipoprotein YifL